MLLERAEAIKARREFIRTVTGRRPTRRRARLPKQKQPDDIRLAYFGELRTRVLRPARQLVMERLVPELPAIIIDAARGDAAIRTDAAGARKVNRLLHDISTDYFRRLTGDDIEAISDKYRKATSDRQRGEFSRQLQVAVGVTVPIHDVKLRPLINHFTATNVALIKTIPQRYFAQVEQRVIEGVGAGKRADELSAEIEGRYQVSESVAKVIARDQIGKFFADLNEARQAELGITHFFWATSADERTCPICWPLNGKRFAWDSPPPEGLPADVHPQCRCGADPDVQALVDSL